MTEKNKAAAELGRLGGLAHGWKRMTPEQRKERARKAGTVSAARRKAAKEAGE